MQGDFEQAIDAGASQQRPVRGAGARRMGRRDEAIAAARREETRYGAIPLLRAFARAVCAGLQGDAGEVEEVMAPFDDRPHIDGEMLFYVAEMHALVGQTERALAMLERAVEQGFHCVAAFEQNVYLAPLRPLERWRQLIARATAAQSVTWRVFDQHRGRALLGL